jgi:hypothetical protein
LSTRFLYYELKQIGFPLANHAKRRSDQDVIDAVMHLRVVGIVPWDWINDETRSVSAWSYAGTIKDGVLDNLPYRRLDLWNGANPPLILTESRGVAAVLRSITTRYLCPIAATNGQVGGFLRTDIVPLIEGWQNILYFGDWNPAGSSIEANTRRVLEDAVGDLDWERMAVTPEQAEERGLPPKPGTDNRYRDGNPHVSYECEALGQSVLKDMLTERLDELLPEPIEDVLEREEEERQAIRRTLQRRRR